MQISTDCNRLEYSKYMKDKPVLSPTGSGRHLKEIENIVYSLHKNGIPQMIFLY